MSAAKHCEYNKDLRGCTGIPTLDATLNQANVVSRGYRTVERELPWFESYFENFVYSAAVPSPTGESNHEYAVWYHDSLDEIRHAHGVYNQRPLDELKRIDGLVADVLASDEWDVAVVSSDHGWKHCNNGINVRGRAPGQSACSHPGRSNVLCIQVQC